MDRYRILSDVVSTFIPEFDLRVFYPGGEVFPGEDISPKEAIREPVVKFNGDPDVLYTILMIDPDIPSRGDPSHAEFRHWVVANIPSLAVSEGEVLSGYRGPSMVIDNLYHRYIFLLYRQSAPITDYFDNKLRSGFDSGEFSFKHNLGDPVAANFFLHKNG